MIDNSVDFEDKIARGLRAVYEALGRPTQQEVWHKYLIALPTLQTLEQTYHAASIDMMQTYLTRANPSIVRRVRQQKNGGDYLYFYTEKRTTGSGQWETEKPISEKEYIRYLMEGDTSLHTVHKTKYRFVYNGCRFEIDVYPFSQDRAIMRAALPENAPVLTAPPEITVLREVTGDPPTKTASWRKIRDCKAAARVQFHRTRAVCFVKGAFRCASGGPFFSVLLEKMGRKETLVTVWCVLRADRVVRHYGDTGRVKP